MAKFAEGICDAIQKELNAFKNGLWPYKTIPKPIIGLLMFIATAKMLDRKDLANDYNSYLQFVIGEQYGFL